MYSVALALALAGQQQPQTHKIEIVMNGPETVRYFYHFPGDPGGRYDQTGKLLATDGQQGQRPRLVPKDKDGIRTIEGKVSGQLLNGQESQSAQPSEDIAEVLRGTDPAAQGYSTARYRAAKVYFRTLGVELDERREPFDPFGWRTRDPWNPTQRIR